MRFQQSRYAKSLTPQLLTNLMNKPPILLSIYIQGTVQGSPPQLHQQVPSCHPAGVAPSIWSSWVLQPRRTFPGRAQSPRRRCGRRGRWGCWPCWAGRGTRSGGSAGTLWPPLEAAADCWSSRCKRALRGQKYGIQMRNILNPFTGNRIYGIYCFDIKMCLYMMHLGHYFKSQEGKRPYIE